MKSRILLIFLSLMLIFSPNIGLADNTNTITYLQNQTQNAWVTQALAAASVNDLNIDYVDVNNNDLMTVAKNVLTLAAVQSTNSETVNTLVSTLNGYFDGQQLGVAEQLNDDFWGLMALSSIGDNTNTLAIKSYILNHQNADGGWSWSITGESDSNDTAAAMMALLEVGLDTNSANIINALNYLQTTQNTDGGFGYTADSESDGSSTAWVISALNKAEINPSTWSVANNNPVIFLADLQLPDGSYKWLVSDEQGSSMTTAFALIALTGHSYPVNYLSLASDQLLVDVRIEGPTDTVCLAGNLTAVTALDLLAVAAEVCDFDYIITETEYGPYVSAIDGAGAAGMSGWQYWVNNQSATVGAADYQLQNNDQILWAFGEFGILPTQIQSTATHLEIGENLIITANYFTGSAEPLVQANIHIGDKIYITNDQGQVSFSPIVEGIYPIYFEQTNNYIRSNKVYLTVGDRVSETVDLSVNINNPDGEDEGDGNIAFTVNQSSIDFGDLAPGQSGETILTLSNTGTANIYIEASILGDNIFTEATTLNRLAWVDFNLDISSQQTGFVNTKLSIPSDFNGNGAQSGQLIFWAIAN